MKTKNLYLLSIISILFLFAGCSKEANKKNLANENWLKVSGNQIVNQKGDTVYLRGFGLGGMLHMENFIDGYPANEESMREGLLEVWEKKNTIFSLIIFLKAISPNRTQNTYTAWD